MLYVEFWLGIFLFIIENAYVQKIETGCGNLAKSWVATSCLCLHMWKMHVFFAGLIIIRLIYLNVSNLGQSKIMSTNQGKMYRNVLNLFQLHKVYKKFEIRCHNESLIGKIDNKMSTILNSFPIKKNSQAKQFAN